MSSKPRRLDATDRRLLGALSRDGRLSAASLAAELGLSRQAVHERVRELERTRVIRGYHADVDPAALGLEVQAHIRMTLDSSPAREAAVLRRLRESPLVRSVHRVSGEDCLVAHVVGRHIEDVTALLKELQATRSMTGSRTAFVLERVLEKGTVGPLEPALLAEPSGDGR